MYRVMIYFFLILKATDSRISKNLYYQTNESAATEAQRRFAEENEYDQTGPGAKKTETAYKTYKTLEDALVAYLDDPDTKLPEADKIKAYHKLLSKNGLKIPFKTPIPSVFISKYHKSQPYKYTSSKSSFLPSVDYYEPWRRIGDTKLNLKELPRPFQPRQAKNAEASSTLNEAEKAEDNFNPEYSFSYGVHDQLTGDSKAAQEARVGDVVSGWYSLLQADGRRRTVHYKADDKQGFIATVHHDKA